MRKRPRPAGPVGTGQRGTGAYNFSRLKNERTKKKNHTTGELHPNNPHRAPYDFPRLVKKRPELAAFLRAHPLGGDTVDFADPAAVKTLNRALLATHYDIEHWDIPEGFLCPPVPSRVDYLHHVAELLASDAGVSVTKLTVSALDIGAGANCIYPILGVSAFGWRFVATDVDPAAVKWAEKLVVANRTLSGKIDCRLQRERNAIFRGAVREGERFAVSVCNPPFHGSAEEASVGTLRKLKNLGGSAQPKEKILNFGGRANELWCEGGEAGFIRRMIRESAERPELCVWFTTLVSKKGTLPIIERELCRAKAVAVRALTMFAGQKQTRVVAWTYLSPEQRRERLKGYKVYR